MAKAEFIEVAPKGISDMNNKFGALILDKTRQNVIDTESQEQIDGLLIRAGEVANAFSGLTPFSLDECAAIGILTACLETQKISYKVGHTSELRNVIKADSFVSLVKNLAVLKGIK
jgi:hypothetical protein